ncbi:MAG: hypothetical protein WDN48_00685 [Pseudolabrys sp.]
MLTSAGLTMAALIGALVLSPAAALAQNAKAWADYASASLATNPTGDPPPPELRGSTDDDTEMLGNALNFDPASLNPKTKPLRLPSLVNRPGLDMSRIDRPDGSSSVAVKQPLPIDWDAKVGADLGLGADAPDYSQANRPLPTRRDSSNSGTAWASVGVVPDLATVDARVDPSNDQGNIRTTLKHSMPLGSKFAVTLLNSYSVTQTYGVGTPAPSDVPLMTAPSTAATFTPQVWGSERAAKFDILPTGTTLGASFASNSTDPVTHNTLSAAQKIYGPLQVTTAVTDVGQTYASKSISARFKLNW